MEILSSIHKSRRAACSFIGLSTAVFAAVLATGTTQAAPGTGKIAFFSDRDGNNEIYLMDPDGTNQTRFTNLPGKITRPTSAPTGAK